MKMKLFSKVTFATIALWAPTMITSCGLQKTPQNQSSLNAADSSEVGDLAAAPVLDDIVDSEAIMRKTVFLTNGKNDAIGSPSRSGQNIKFNSNDEYYDSMNGRYWGFRFPAIGEGEIEIVDAYLEVTYTDPEYSYYSNFEMEIAASSWVKLRGTKYNKEKIEDVFSKNGNSYRMFVTSYDIAQRESPLLRFNVSEIYKNAVAKVGNDTKVTFLMRTPLEIDSKAFSMTENGGESRLVVRYKKAGIQPDESKLDSVTYGNGFVWSRYSATSKFNKLDLVRGTNGDLVINKDTSADYTFFEFYDHLSEGVAIDKAVVSLDFDVSSDELNFTSWFNFSGQSDWEYSEESQSIYFPKYESVVTSNMSEMTLQRNATNDRFELDVAEQIYKHSYPTSPAVHFWLSHAIPQPAVLDAEIRIRYLSCWCSDYGIFGMALAPSK